MRVIKDSLKVFVIDWQRIIKNPFALFIIVGMMIIPSMYAWFNIEALWDPYGNASNLPIAVYSDDDGVTIKGHYINVGDGVIDNLKENEELNWQFPVSNEKMIETVKSGENYGSIYLPHDFSKKITGIIDGKYDKPEIEYRVNEKINAIAPKMTEAGMEGLEAGITEGFNKVVSDVAFTAMKDAGLELDSRIPLINRVASALHDINGKQDDINKMLNKVTDSRQSLVDFQTKVNQVDLTSLENAGDDAVAVVGEVNDQMPGLLELQPLITNLNDNSGLITDFATIVSTVDQDVKTLDGDLTKVSKNIDKAVSVLNDTLEVVKSADTYGGDINKMLADIKATSKDVGPVINNISVAADSSIKLVNLIASDVASDAAALSTFVADNTLSDDELAKISEILKDLANNLTNGQTLIENVLSTLKPLNVIGHGKFDDIIAALNTVDSLLGAAAGDVTNLSDNMSSLSNEQIINQINQISTDADRIVNSTSSLSTASINEEIQAILTQVAENASSGSELVDQIGDIDVTKFINSITANLDIIQSYAQDVQSQLPKFESFIADLDSFMNENGDQMISAIANLNQFWTTDLPTISEQVGNIDSYLSANWSGIKSEMETAKSTVDTQLPKLIDVVDKVQTFQDDQWPDLSKFISDADRKMTDLTKNKQLKKVVDLLVNDVEAGSDFVASPVAVNTIRMYPSQNYGSSSSPFYTALCLWVGALLLSSLLSTRFTPKGDFTPSVRGEYLGRYLTFLSIGIVQMLVVAVGDIYLIGIEPVSPVYFVLFALLIEVCFMSIIYTLGSLFGNVGKALGIVGLVLSISGGGGNFPIQVSANFFQNIYPFLPFTHAVNLLRESIGGIYPPTVYHAASVLLAYTIGSLLFGFILSTHINPLIDKVEHKSEESHIFH